MNKLCECGCDQEVKSLSNKFIHGHQFKCKKTQERRKLTCLKKYGVSNVSQSINIKNKKKETCLEHYGIEVPSQSKDIRQKTKETCFINNGVYVPYQSEKIREKGKKTFLERLGVDNPFRLEEIKQKIKDTNLKKYGVDHFSKSPEGRLMGRKSTIQRIETQKLNGEPLTPCIGALERECLNELQKLINYSISRNDYQISYKTGFYPDGYIKELNLIIEFDEHWHEEPKIKKRDIRRESFLKESLSCNIFRIQEYNWKNNKENIIKEFLLLIDKLKKETDETS